MVPRLATLAALALAACDGNGKLDEGPHCEDTPTPIGLDETSPLGFSAADILAELPAEESAVFVWADDTETDLALAFRPSDTARFVDSEPVYPEGEQPAIGVICDDRVEVDLSWDFATADGAFDETLDGPLRATTAESVTLSTELDLDALSGTFDLDDWTEETEYDDRSAWIGLIAEGGATRGDVYGQISGGDDDCQPGDVCTAWAAEVPVGSWGASETASR